MSQSHRLTSLFRLLLTVAIFTAACHLLAAEPFGYKDTPFLPGSKWRVHDRDRPQPPTVTPGRTDSCAAVRRHRALRRQESRPMDRRQA